MSNNNAHHSSPPPRRLLAAHTIIWGTLVAAMLVTGCKENNPKCERAPQHVPRGGFTFIADALPRQTEPSISSLGDCNGDGLLDVLRPHDGTILIAKPDGPFQVQSLSFSLTQGMLQDVDGDGVSDLILPSVEIRRGRGDCTFDETMTPLPGYGSTLALRVQDVDHDGLDDIVETLTGAAGTPPVVVRLGRGDGNYDVVTVLGAGPGNAPKTGLPVFNTFLHDVDGDGLDDGFFLSDDNTSWFSWGIADEHLAFSRDDALTSLLAAINPMSMTVLDADRDGRFDYFFSGTVNGNVLLHGAPGRTLQNTAAETCVQEHTEALADSWSSLAFDADFDGWTDLLVLRQPYDLVRDPTTQKPGRPNLFLNQRDGAFLDVAELMAPTQVQGIKMTCGDLRSNGRISCYVDGDATTSLLQNQIEQTNPWVGLRLQGTLSGITAAGSRVSVDDAQPPRIYFSGGQAGTYTTHSSDMLIAANPDADTDVTITWPSGLEQSVKALPPGQYTTVREPEVFQISRRVAPADGASTVEITLRPQLANAREATVERSGAGTWEGPLTFGDSGALTRTLKAPSTKGIARLQISLDGKPLLVRPRILFE